MGSERAPAAARVGVAALLLLAAATLGVGCADGVRRFPVKPPLWVDPDRNDVPEKPAEYFSGLYADAVDKTLLRPLTEFLAFRRAGEAWNVNAWDEVPNSAWFTNRIGWFPMTPEDVAEGSCGGHHLSADDGPWTVTHVKSEGVTPGFFIRAADGVGYLLKVDDEQPERGTAADAIAARIYHAIGYFAPCNDVVFFRPDIFVLGEGAVVEDATGDERPITQAAVDAVLRKAYATEDGRLRMVASRLVDGEPIGPHPLEGVRADDPNDVVPHQHRRGLRGARLVAAWLGHFDVREQNSLDSYVEEQGRRYVRHYQLDFGDSFGSPWASEALNRRVGHGYTVDFGQILADLLSLGAIPRPWFRSRVNDVAEIFGHFGWRDFEPLAWRPVYPNPAFQNMTWRDGLWMARILARFRDAHIRALVETGRFSDPLAARYLEKALEERRDAILRAFLLEHVPLADFRLGRPGAEGRQRLCFTDLAIRHLDRDRANVVYRATLMAGVDPKQKLGVTRRRPAEGRPDVTCLPLPIGSRRPAQRVAADAPLTDPRRYAVLHLDVWAPPSAPRPFRVDLHVVDRGPERGFLLVGIDRIR